MGQYYVLYLIAVAKFSDMGAYLTGSRHRPKHKMVPHISPGKTWEGFGGALGVFRCWRATALHALMPVKAGVPARRYDVVICWCSAWCSSVASRHRRPGGIRAQARHRRQGFRPHLLPGIGGVLDLIDSLLFTAPLLFFLSAVSAGARSRPASEFPLSCKSVANRSCWGQLAPLDRAPPRSPPTCLTASRLVGLAAHRNAAGPGGAGQPFPPGGALCLVDEHYRPTHLRQPPRRRATSRGLLFGHRRSGRTRRDHVGGRPRAGGHHRHRAACGPTLAANAKRGTGPGHSQQGNPRHGR